MNFVYARKGCRKSGDRLDLFHRIIECRNNRNTDHQSSFSVERNFPCIFQHQSVSPSCKLLMFFLVHMFDIHQIYIQVRKNLFDLFPGSTCHALYCGINTTFFCRTEKISGKIRLTHTFTTGKGNSSSGAIIICAVFLHFLDHLANCHITADHLVLTQNFHVLDPVLL